MGFHPVYYIVMGAPDFEKTLDMIDRYVARGVTAVQLDMPSRNPYGESDYIKEKMAHALRLYPTYDLFMNAIRKIRARHPSLEIHLVVYPDVVEEIGLDRFMEFCLEIRLYSVLGARNRETLRQMNERGIVTSVFIDADLNEAAIENARLSDKHIVMLRNRKEGVEAPAGVKTCRDRVEYVRARGVKAPIFFVQGIENKAMLEEVKASGCGGAYIGTTLMKLWDDEQALWALLDLLQSCAD